MLNKLLLLLCLSSFVASSSFAEAPSKASKVGEMRGGIELVFPDWFKESFLDFRDDAEEAGDEGKHLLVFFHVAGCPYCKKMLDDNFTSGVNAKSIQADFESIHIDLKGENFILRGYKNEFKHVILNIINNAKDALLENNDIKNRKIEIALENNSIFIRDNAGGIDENIMDKIFDNYFTTKEEGKGTGKGMGERKRDKNGMKGKAKR